MTSTQLDLVMPPLVTLCCADWLTASTMLWPSIAGHHFLARLSGQKFMDIVPQKHLAWLFTTSFWIGHVHCFATPQKQYSHKIQDRDGGKKRKGSWRALTRAWSTELV